MKEYDYTKVEYSKKNKLGQLISVLCIIGGIVGGIFGLQYDVVAILCCGGVVGLVTLTTMYGQTGTKYELNGQEEVMESPLDPDRYAALREMIEEEIREQEGENGKD